MLNWYFLCHLSSFRTCQRRLQQITLPWLLRAAPPLNQQELLRIIQVKLRQCQGRHLSFQARAHQYLTGLQHNQACRWLSAAYSLPIFFIKFIIFPNNLLFLLHMMLFMAIIHSQPSEHPSTSDWPTFQPSEKPSLSSQPSVDPTPSPSNAPTNAVSCWAVWSIVYSQFLSLSTIHHLPLHLQPTSSPTSSPSATPTGSVRLPFVYISTWFL